MSRARAARSPFNLHISFVFFNDTATTEIYTLSLHDALPISAPGAERGARPAAPRGRRAGRAGRSEEHTSELQSRSDIVCRLLLEKKNNIRHCACEDSACRHFFANPPTPTEH